MVHDGDGSADLVREVRHGFQRSDIVIFCIKNMGCIFQIIELFLACERYLHDKCVPEDVVISFLLRRFASDMFDCAIMFKMTFSMSTMGEINMAFSMDLFAKDSME